MLVKNGLPLSPTDLSPSRMNPSCRPHGLCGLLYSLSRCQIAAQELADLVFIVESLDSRLKALGIPVAWLSSIPVSGTHQRSCNSPRNNYSSCESKNMCILPNHWTRQRPPAECFLSLLRAGSEATVSTVASLCFDGRKLKIITNREKNSNHKSNCSALETVERTLN